jgi:hypothetical protein
MSKEIEKNGGLIVPSTTPAHDDASSDLQGSDIATFVDVKIDPENFRKLEEMVKSFPGGKIANFHSPD